MRQFFKQMKNGERITVPRWTISTFKFMGPVVVAVAIGYGRFVIVESRLKEVEQRVHDGDTKGTASDIVVQAIDRRLNTAEVKETVLEKDLSASLTRLEVTLKDIQGDVKELQKRK